MKRGKSRVIHEERKSIPPEDYNSDTESQKDFRGTPPKPLNYQKYKKSINQNQQHIKPQLQNKQEQKSINLEQQQLNHKQNKLSKQQIEEIKIYNQSIKTLDKTLTECLFLNKSMNLKDDQDEDVYEKYLLFITSDRNIDQDQSANNKNRDIQGQKDQKLDFKSALIKNKKAYNSDSEEEQNLRQIQIQNTYSLIVTNGMDKLYKLPLIHEFMQQHRERTGIEGTWESFFVLFKNALEQKSLSLKTLKNQIVIHNNEDDNFLIQQHKLKHKQQLLLPLEQQEQLILQLHYPLMIGAKITGTFELTQHEVKGRERHEIIRDVLFDIATMSLQQKSNLQRVIAQSAVSSNSQLGVQEAAEKHRNDLNANGGNNYSQYLDVGLGDQGSGQPQKKRKPQGTLVNPNLKKRKIAGAKF
eukprot:403338161